MIILPNIPIVINKVVGKKIVGTMKYLGTCMNCILIKDKISIGNVAMQSMQIFKLLFLIFIYYECELKFRTQALHPNLKYNYYCEKVNNYMELYLYKIFLINSIQLKNYE